MERIGMITLSMCGQPAPTAGSAVAGQTRLVVEVQALATFFAAPSE